MLNVYCYDNSTLSDIYRAPRIEAVGATRDSPNNMNNNKKMKNSNHRIRILILIIMIITITIIIIIIIIIGATRGGPPTAPPQRGQVAHTLLSRTRPGRRSRRAGALEAVYVVCVVLCYWLICCMCHCYCLMCLYLFRNAGESSDGDGNNNKDSSLVLEAVWTYLYPKEALW